MTNDGILVLQCLGQTIWKLFTSWHIPGTYVTPAAAFLFLLCAVIGLKFFGRVTNMPIDPDIVDEAVQTRYAVRNIRLVRGDHGGIGFHDFGGRD